jgi:peroxiredoxin
MLRIRSVRLVALLSLLFLAVSTSWSAEVGDRIPDFSVQSLEGETLSRATYAGKPLLLVFWNTWCSDCRRELPKIRKLRPKLRSMGLAVLAINTGINDTEEKTRRYWEEKGYDFPTAFDYRFEAITAFVVRGVPTLLLVDAEGVIRFKNARLPKDAGKRFRELVALSPPDPK